jgi:hypothetical protein
MMKVTTVEALPKHRLRVTLDTGKVLELSVAEYLTAPGYVALKKAPFFAQVGVEEWGNGVEWPGDIGIPVSALYRLAQEQAGQAYPVERFNDWMQRNGLSATAAARALGLTRRTIIYYHTGGKPIPLVVGLACDGYEARLKNAA